MKPLDKKASRTVDRPQAYGTTIRMMDGCLQIEVPEGTLPAFLTEANQAVSEGRLEEAKSLLCPTQLARLSRDISGDLRRPEVMLIAGRLLYDTGQYDPAEKWYLRALEHVRLAVVYHHLSHICARNRHRLTEAVHYSQKALEIEPDNIWYACAHAGLLMRVGRVEEGMTRFQRAAAQAPDNPAIGGMCLWNRHYLPEKEDPQAIYTEYRRLAQYHAPVRMARRHHDNIPDPDRVLRVGFISPDFRAHSVGRSFEPFLDGYQGDRLETYGYGYVKNPDTMTRRLAGKFNHYRPVRDLSFDAIAELIVRDGIDILVTHGGHSQDNCLAVLARKPAPVQVDYGGIDTNGMDQIDYRLSDTILDPPQWERYYTETSVYLPGGLASLRPPDNSPLVGPLPAERNGFVTFGSFNNNVKINSQVLSLWAQILKACPRSRMILKFPAGSDAGVRDYYVGQFQHLGVGPERIEVHGLLPDFAHLDLYNRIDLTLDTYPYNGCITLLESMWMGVPPISLVGPLYVSRVGLDVLTRVGLEVFAAHSAQEYVAKACAYAHQLDHLKTIRGSLRRQMLESPVCQPGRLARELEDALVMMWHHWCETQPSVRREVIG